MTKRLFTSESVTEGHPDKMADQISDAILDSLLSQDAKSRVAVETLITTGQVHVAGEVTTNGYADVMTIVRDTVLNIGYDSSEKGFDGNSCGVSLSIGQQSSDIAQGVDSAFEKRISSSADPLDLQGAVDLLMLKVAPLGGITRAREIGAHHQLPLVVSSALDSAVGIGYGLQLAASLPTLEYACGLATGQLLSSDIATLPLEKGQMSVQSVSPDAELLAKYAVPVERLTWWKERTTRAFYAGTESEIKARGWQW